MNASHPWASTDDPWDTPAPDPVEPNPATLEGLLELLVAQKQLLISVATDGPQTRTLDVNYKKRRRTLNDGLRSRGIRPPFPFDDLWTRHGQRTSGNLPSHASRRSYIAGLSNPVKEQLEAMLDGIQVSDRGSEPIATWASLDARVEGTISELRDGRTKDDHQDVGRRCRGVLSDIAQLLTDPALIPADQAPPQDGNAKELSTTVDDCRQEWLGLFMTSQAGGRSHAQLRKFIPVAWDPAQKVTHCDTGRVDAYAAAQATVLVVPTLQQLASDELA